jgi:hypothetical protein
VKDRDKTEGMKSAYELALERLERQGIARPSGQRLDDETRQRIAELRRDTEAKLAELEILLKDRLASTADPDERTAAESEYAAERRRVRDRLGREIEKLRSMD